MFFSLHQRSAASFVLIGLLWGCVCTAAWSAERRALGDENWLELSAGEYRVIGSLRQNRALDLVVQLRVLRELLSRGADGGEGAEAPATVIVAFGRSSDFLRYSPWRESDPVDGYFHTDGETSYVVIDARRGTAWHQTALHEAVHSELHAAGRGHLPLWIQEGLAEFYSTLQVKGRQALVGLPIEQHVRLLRTRPWLDLDQLVRTAADSPLYESGEQGEIFYAQSWLLVHFLLLDPQRSAHLHDALEHLEHRGSEVSAPELIEALGFTEHELKRELRRWVRVPHLPFLRAPVEHQSLEIVERKLQRAEILARLGDLLANRRDGAALVRMHFVEALRLDPRQRLAFDGMLRLQQLSQR